ncbi:hypothetical protein BT63DRAFT_457149 [Microthyrium microscopicum]|uniref:Peroxin 20 n=1 Tax=Microthyrium microscopicum TaxID=703497 RepID=A0A6A6U8C5_9PEZI|nr:hypothetical protein BT63DRAFT_457149 [Microthyrium microscopicum]
MADALCGPSNPLQNFQKHTQQDRSSQQDRLVSRAGPSQGFRSPSQNAGLLDPEFEAFQAGHPTPAVPLAAPSPFFQQSFPQRHQTPFSQPAVIGAAPDWALDFQRLNLSSPSPASQQHAHQAPSAFSQAPMASQPSITAGASYSSPMFNSYSTGMMGAGYGPGVGMGYMPGQEERMLEAQNQAQKQTPVFDDAAFAAAFDDAAAFLQPQPQTASDLKASKSLAMSEMDALMRSEEELDAIMSGAVMPEHNDSDYATFEINKVHFHDSVVTHEPLLQEESKQQEERFMDVGDALAQTAGQLLDSVSHETSEKFAQSSFLELMRRLRDREVKVDGDNFIDSSTNAIANTTGEESMMMDPVPPQLPDIEEGGPGAPYEPVGES